MMPVGVGAMILLTWALIGPAPWYVEPGSLEADADPALCRLAEDQVRRYPRARIADLYKFAHQAAFGAGHAVSDSRHARDWLMREIEELPAGDPGASSPPLLEPLLPDGSLVRVHLRPWVEAGHDSEQLVSAFVRTANAYRGSQSILLAYWECFRDLARNGSLTSDASELDPYMREQQQDGWPARHHSAVFESEYAPAYRVVSRRELPESLER